MTVLRYRITLQEPTLVTALQGDPNSAVAFDYLPGSVLRGAFIAAYARQHKIKTESEDLPRMFFDGSVRFLNGYIAHGDRRAIPAPLSWVIIKNGDESAIHDLLWSQPDEQTKGYSGFIIPTGKEIRRVTIQRHIMVHTQRERISGRPLGQTADLPDGTGGTVYRYDALAAGQVFEAFILCGDHDTAPFVKLMDKVLYLGGARSAGYGHVQIDFIETISDTELREIPDPMNTNGNIFTLTLLSDVILRNQWGQPCAELSTLQTALKARLGITTAVESSFLGMTMVGGFNRKWGLPLPQTPALRMGSVIRFSLSTAVDPSISEDMFTTLVREGLGERRAEGFGRVAINWQTEDKSEYMLAGLSSKPETAAVMPEAPTQIFVVEMFQRMLRREIDQRAVTLAHTFDYDLRGIPRSQLARLRVLVLDQIMQQKPDTSVIEKFLKDIEGKRADKLFSRARINTGEKSLSLKKWLAELARTPSEASKKLYLSSGELARFKPIVNDEIHNYVALKLVDAVLAQGAEMTIKAEGDR